MFASDFISRHRRPAARRVVILFSHGIDTISLRSAADAMRSTLDTGALIYSVDMGNPQKSSTQRSIENSGARSLSNSPARLVDAISPPPPRSMTELPPS